MVADLRREFRSLGWRARRRASAEARDHLVSAVEQEVAAGASFEDAERRAFARFGDPVPIAVDLRAVHPRWGSRGLRAAVGALALLAGFAALAVAYVASAGAPPATAALRDPQPLRGIPPAGANSTGLRLLVAGLPPFLLNVDTGEVTRITGLRLGGAPVLAVQPVGRDAVVWLSRLAPAAKLPTAEIYVVRHGTTRAKRIASAWQVAPSADGAAVWLKSYRDAHHCTLREVALDGRQRHRPRAVGCSAELIDSGSGAMLSQGASVIDPDTGQTVAHTGRLWARAGGVIITTTGPQSQLALTDQRSGKSWSLPYPSAIGGQGGRDEQAVERHQGLVALAFGDPAYGFSGTQVLDIWLLDPSNRHLQELPDMPADVLLKFTSMQWSSDGRLVILGESGERQVVATWKPGQRRLTVRPVRMPARTNGSDSFVVSTK